MKSKYKVLVRRKVFKITRNLIFVALIVLLVFVYGYAYWNKEHALNVREPKNSNTVSTILFGDYKKSDFNLKTPRGLFVTFSNSMFLAWCGYYKEIPTAMNCVNPGITDSSELKIGQRNELSVKCKKLLVSILENNFSAEDVPGSISGDKGELKLGYGKNSQTFYFAKKKDGNWYFTEKNFINPETEDRFRLYQKRNENIDSEESDYSNPLSAYCNFIMGVQGKFGMNYDDAEKVINLSWVSPLVKEKYGKFMAYVLFKVIEAANVNAFTVSYATKPTQKVDILCTSKLLGYSIYLHKKTLNKEGDCIWLFNRKVQKTAIDIFTFEKMKVNPEQDPFWFTEQHWLWVNLPFLQFFIFGLSTYMWLRIIIGFFVLYIVFFVTKKVIGYILNVLGRKKSIRNYRKYARGFSRASAIISALFFYNYLIEYSIILYYNLFLYYSYFLTIAYGILFIWWLCELVCLICTSIGFILKQNRGDGFRIEFVVELIQRLLCIMIIIVFTGVLLQKIGVNMINVLTALGIGGLAIAFAGKDTIENLFGSIMIALEKTFKIGDWIVIGDIEGDVEHIGLRSTRIRTFKDSYLTVPNVKFITTSVDNMGARTYRRYDTMLDVEDSTSPGLLQSFTEGINEIIKTTPSMRKKGNYIKVNNIGESSIKILVYVFFLVEDWGEELDEREKFILNILRLAEEMNIRLAYPTQTLKIAKYKEMSEKEAIDLTPKQLNEKISKARTTAKKIVEKFIDKEK